MLRTVKEDSRMIIARAPYRVSFFGGGTDYPSWYEKFGGAVLSTTLDRYCYISLRRMQPFLGSKYRIFWSKAETVDRLEEIEHAGVRGCLQAMEVDDGIEVNHAGDLPARSGLGSSSSFTVAMLQALHALKGEEITKFRLANEAIHVEQEVLGETVGVQDQISAACGGFNFISINEDGSYAVSPAPIYETTKTKLEKNLLLFFTGIQRNASEIAATYANNTERKKLELTQISKLTFEALEAIEKGDIDEIGHLLHSSWMLKRSLADSVSSPFIDSTYQRALRAGALGGKILGAGGGGFFLFYSPEPDSVRKALSHLIEVPFRFGSEGSQIILNET